VSEGLRAAVETAEDLGLRFDRPVILRDLSNLLVHLTPAPVVARVATTTGTVRPGEAWLAREVAVAGYLASAGAPVVAPSAEVPPGPHRCDGLALTFWEYAEPVDAPLDPRAAGRGLRQCHEALAGYPGELPPLAVLDEVARLVPAGLESVARSLRERIEALALPLQAVHGDAHLRNVINTARGPLWNDWEDTFLGPVAWDLGCLHASARAFGHDPAPVTVAQAGYGAAPEPAVLDLFVEARRLQVTVWSLVIAERHPHIRGDADRWLAHYTQPNR
jgi:Phosphotransferase enzyme family